MHEHVSDAHTNTSQEAHTNTAQETHTNTFQETHSNKRYTRTRTRTCFKCTHKHVSRGTREHVSGGTHEHVSRGTRTRLKRHTRHEADTNTGTRTRFKYIRTCLKRHTHEHVSRGTLEQEVPTNTYTNTFQMHTRIRLNMHTNVSHEPLLLSALLCYSAPLSGPLLNRAGLLCCSPLYGALVCKIPFKRGSNLLCSALLSTTGPSISVQPNCNRFSN